MIVGKYATPWEMRAKLDATLAEEEKIEAHALQVAEDRTAKEKKRRDRLKKLRLDEERYVSARGCCGDCCYSGRTSQSKHPGFVIQTIHWVADA